MQSANLSRLTLWMPAAVKIGTMNSQLRSATKKNWPGRSACWTESLGEAPLPGLTRPPLVESAQTSSAPGRSPGRATCCRGQSCRTSSGQGIYFRPLYSALLGLSPQVDHLSWKRYKLVTFNHLSNIFFLSQDILYLTF